VVVFLFNSYETDEMAQWGEPISTRTLSNHWRGPCKWISIQQGVLVTSCRWYSAPQPFTNDILSLQQKKTFYIKNGYIQYIVH